MNFSTKAETLAILEKYGKSFSVLPQVCMTVNELLNNHSDYMLHRLNAANINPPYIVRSSAFTEDTSGHSNAGAYLSLSGVTEDNIFTACKQVADSYHDNSLENQILIQPMLKNIKASGVLFTIDPNTGGNYFVINYDDSDSVTGDSVTSGKCVGLKTHYLFHKKISQNTFINKLSDCAAEIMDLFKNNAVDIEFAFTSDDILYVFQARPLILTLPIADYEEQTCILNSAKEYLTREMKPQFNVKGHTTIYSVMADWNPAEMIGTRPKPLALSLYRRLITDGVWAFQRDNYGYKNLRSFPLLRLVCGVPFIDTRVSFNSFIPKALDDELTEKLAAYYLRSLYENPEKHDKVEFEILFSCYTFDIKQRTKDLKKYGFSDTEIERLTNALKDLTNHIINVKDGLWITDSNKIEKLKMRHNAVLTAESDDLTKIYWLMEDCARYGTLPFAGLARAGFIAVQLLKSLVAVGIMTESDYYDYMSELNTVGSQMVSDRNDLTNSAFLKKYGHLRPGTYEITSPRYDAAADIYFKESAAEEKVNPKAMHLTLSQYGRIQSLMAENGLTGDVLDLFKFIKAGIEGREWSKFVFTKSVSDTLERIAKWGGEYGIGREDLAYLDISSIDVLYSSSQNAELILKDSIREGKKQYMAKLQNVLPPVLNSPDDIFDFEMPDLVANYIGQKSAYGNVICDDNINKADLEHKILFILAADPGYDWIFSHNIAGFVTAYGGVNSHMAIRAGELRIPAVIGIGELQYTRYKNAKTVRLDCANKRIEIIC